MPNKITLPQAGRTRRASTTNQSSRRTFLATAGSGLAATVVASGFPSIVPSSGPGRRVAVEPDQRRRHRHRPHLAGSRPARHHAARHRPRRGGLRSRQEARRGRQGPDREGLHGEVRSALHGRHDLHRLPRAAGQPGHRRRRHQHARSPARHPGHRGGPRGQGHLPAEAGVADDQRGPRGGGRRAPLRPHLPDRQPAALDHPVPLRRRTGPQRPHRRPEDRRSRAARRSGGRRSDAGAGACRLRLRRVARIDAGRALRRSTASIRRTTTGVPAGCAASSSAPA